MTDETTEDGPVKQLLFGRPRAIHSAKCYSSPGTMVAGRPRPTAPRAGAELNHVTFRTGEKQLVFSDGSFRAPGRRHLLVQHHGVVEALSGRQLRNLRKATRRGVKAAQAKAVPTAE